MIKSCVLSYFSIAFYPRKLNVVQRRYITTEHELLSTIESCKEFKEILLGFPIIVFTDHKNNTFSGLKESDVFLLLKEYGVSFEYLSVKKIVVAGALSCLGIDELKWNNLHFYQNQNIVTSNYQFILS